MDGMGGRRRKVDNSKYYELLGVAKDSSSSQIKKAYRKLAMTHHPDKGGDEERFKEITTAFEVLNDDDKRQIYDEYGEGRPS
uniref:DnaJ protein n=1 Tax=Griffithsia japonica TaxID=83288 RepID=Q7XZ62_GRIJA|nr:DnaJ protein [Griffithsia japonica]